MINNYKQTSTKKQNQRQNGTTATTTNTQEAERCANRSDFSRYALSEKAG
ncbi:hypothetical protein HMPREF1581_00854, partial [Gardnerella vaginalis JCP8108]